MMVKTHVSNDFERRFDMLTKVVYIVLFLAIFVVISIGCSSRLNKIYGYEPASYKCESGVFGAKLIGTYKTQKGLTTKGSPYELLVWYETEMQVNSHLAKISLILRDRYDKTVIKKIKSMEKNFEQSSDGKYVAYFSIKDLKLEYIKYALAIELEVKTEYTTISETADLDFEKNYQEYRSNDFWDKISSV